MYFSFNQFGALLSWLLTGGVIYLRYLVLAGLAYLFFYHWSQRWHRRKIQTSFPLSARIWGELRESFVTALVFAAVGTIISWLYQAGWTQLYQDFWLYGMGYAAFSLGLLIVVHDAYFYGLHRLLHQHSLLRRIHAVHHGSHNPTPLAAHAFHPLEALLEIAIIFPVVLWVPLHPFVLGAFGLWAITWNIVGHLGYELFPAGWLQHPVARYLNTSTHHNQHHRDGRYNFGLYFNVWDRIFGTNHPDYERTFRAIHKRTGSRLPAHD